MIARFVHFHRERARGAREEARGGKTRGGRKPYLSHRRFERFTFLDRGRVARGASRISWEQVRTISQRAYWVSGAQARRRNSRGNLLGAKSKLRHPAGRPRYSRDTRCVHACVHTCVVSARSRGSCVSGAERGNKGRRCSALPLISSHVHVRLFARLDEAKEPLLTERWTRILHKTCDFTRRP